MLKEKEEMMKKIGEIPKIGHYDFNSMKSNFFGRVSFI